MHAKKKEGKSCPKLFARSDATRQKALRYFTVPATCLGVGRGNPMKCPTCSCSKMRHSK